MCLFHGEHAAWATALQPSCKAAELQTGVPSERAACGSQASLATHGIAVLWVLECLSSHGLWMFDYSTNYHTQLRRSINVVTPGVENSDLDGSMDFLVVVQAIEFLAIIG